MCPQFPLNVAHHKIFRGKPSFVDKEMDEKGRVGVLSTEEIHEIVDNAVSGTINKAAKFVHRWLSWLSIGLPRGRS